MARLTDPIPDTIYISLEKEYAYKLSDVLHKIIGSDDWDERLSLEEFNALSEFSHTLTKEII